MYYITSYRHSEIGHWRPVTGRTLSAAKAACTREFGDGFNDSTLQVGAMRNGRIRCIASKSNRSGSRWR